MCLFFSAFWGLPQTLPSLLLEAFVSPTSAVFHFGFDHQQVLSFVFFFSFFPMRAGVGTREEKNESPCFQKRVFWSVSEIGVGFSTVDVPMAPFWFPIVFLCLSSAWSLWECLWILLVICRVGCFSSCSVKDRLFLGVNICWFLIYSF